MGTTRLLATPTTLTDPTSGVSVTFPAGKAPPEWAAALIDNQSAWVPEDEEATEGPVNYVNKTVPELIDLVRDRELSPESTKKADLVKALEDDDDS